MERRTADEHAVELRFREQLGDVLEIHAAAVQDAGLRHAAGGEPAANLAVHLGGVPGRGILAGADRPHRLVCRRDLADRKSTRLNSSHSQISYAVFCLKKKKTENEQLRT